MATHSSILAWAIPWTEKPGGLQSMGLPRVGHNWAISLSFFLSFFEVHQETKGKPDIGLMTRYSSTSSKFGEDFLYPQDTMTKESY